MPDTLPDHVTNIDLLSWADLNGNPLLNPNYKNLQYRSDVLRHTEWYSMATPYESESIDLMTPHDIYLHSPNLGHFNSLGVRGRIPSLRKSQYPVISDI